MGCPLYISIILQLLSFLNWQHEWWLLQSISPFNQWPFFWFRPCWKHHGYLWGLPQHAQMAQEGMSLLGFFPWPVCSPRTSSCRPPLPPGYTWPGFSHSSSSISFSSTPFLCSIHWFSMLPLYELPNPPLWHNWCSPSLMIPLIYLPWVLTDDPPWSQPWTLIVPLYWILPLIPMAPSLGIGHRLSRPPDTSPCLPIYKP